MPTKFNITLQAQLSELRALADMVEAFGSTHELTPRTTFAINLALDELITNVLVHGKFEDDVEPLIEVDLIHHDNTTQLVVESNDVQFDPTEDTNPDTESDLLSRGIGGLGLHLVKAQASRVSYKYIDGKNQLVLEYDVDAS